MPLKTVRFGTLTRRVRVYCNIYTKQFMFLRFPRHDARIDTLVPPVVVNIYVGKNYNTDYAKPQRTTLYFVCNKPDDGNARGYRRRFINRNY